MQPQNQKISWQQTRPIRPLTRHTCGNIPENKVIAEIRDEELRNPAPFGDKTLIMVNQYFELFEYPPGFDTKATYPGESGYVDIPIRNIAGVFIGNLNNFEPGMTFREVLFNCMHGLHFSDESVEFLVGDQLKDQPMPYDKTYASLGKTPRAGMAFSKYGEWYIVAQGVQRVLLAMFAIYQRHGINGVIKNVPVTD